MLSKKAFQNSLRALMVAGSVTGFLGGWVFLAHSGKPVSSSDVTQAVTEASLPPLDLKALAPSSNTQVAPLQSLPALSSQTSALPRFRTRGS
jgi:hypothetical protein